MVRGYSVLAFGTVAVCNSIGNFNVLVLYLASCHCRAGPGQCRPQCPFRVIGTVEKDQVSRLKSGNSFPVRIPVGWVHLVRYGKHYVNRFPTYSPREVSQRIIHNKDGRFL